MQSSERKPITFAGDSTKMLEMLELAKKLADSASGKECQQVEAPGVDNFRINDKKKSQRVSTYHDIEELVGIWYNNQIQNNIKPTTFEIRQEAIKTARNVGRKDFNASNGWVYRFRKLYVKGEPESTKVEEVEQNIKPAPTIFNEKSVNLTEIFSKYTSENLFVVDECLLYYKRLPKCYFSTMNPYCKSQSKDKVLVLLCCNMLGEEKLKPLIIGPNIDYRVFKKIEQFPCKFIKKDQVQMSLSIFFDWLSEFNNYYRAKDRKIAIFVKPSEYHNTSYAFSHVQVVFYPSSIYSDCHPMDSGILLNFKCHFRKLLCQKYRLYQSFKCCKEVEQFSETINIIDCIYTILSAWESVDREVVIESYKILFKMSQAKEANSSFDPEFTKQVSHLDEVEDDDSEPASSIKALIQLHKDDAFWALNIVKNAIIQLGKPVYKEFLRIEEAVMGKDMKPVQDEHKVDYWY